jgi:hypothetical protein
MTNLTVHNDLHVRPFAHSPTAQAEQQGLRKARAKGMQIKVAQ